MLNGFAKANSRIKHHLFEGHAPIVPAGHATIKKCLHIINNIPVLGRLLHGLGCAQHVHGNITCAGFRNQLPHGLVLTDGGNVVDDHCAGLHSGLGDGWFLRVDGQGSLGLACKFFDDGNHAA